LDILGVELQVSACSDAADLALLHPLIKSFEMTAEDGLWLLLVVSSLTSSRILVFILLMLALPLTSTIL
jgi:hypothetical protein